MTEEAISLHRAEPYDCSKQWHTAKRKEIKEKELRSISNQNKVSLEGKFVSELSDYSMGYFELTTCRV